MTKMKPTVLYTGQPIMFAHTAGAEFSKNFNILTYDLNTRAELIEAFSADGKYSKIDAIIRPNLSPTILPPLDKELVSYLPPSCKIVSYCNHGYDGEDVEALERRGIWYCNSAGGATESTADIGLFLILAAFRFITFGELTLREKGEAQQSNVQEICAEAQEPSGKILGIVGMGGIGTAVARRAHALGMTIHYFNRIHKDPDVEESLGKAVYHETLESLLEACDCLLLTCPHTPETNHLVNGTSLSNMKRGSRIVNIGRGKCIDEDALADALETGQIKAAALDVFHDEPVISPRLLKTWRVTLLPHMAGSTIDADRKFEEIAMKNLEVFFLGDGKPLTPVNKVQIEAKDKTTRNTTVEREIGR